MAVEDSAVELDAEGSEAGSADGVLTAVPGRLHSVRTPLVLAHTALPGHLDSAFRLVRERSVCPLDPLRVCCRRAIRFTCGT